MAPRTLPLSRGKRCSSCKDWHPLSYFGRNRQAKDGLHYYCKACAAKRQKQWAKANPAVVKRMRTDYLIRVRAANEDRNPYEQ
jgi:hypothetical protein